MAKKKIEKALSFEVTTKKYDVVENESGETEIRFKVVSLAIPTNVINPEIFVDTFIRNAHWLMLANLENKATKAQTKVANLTSKDTSTPEQIAKAQKDVDLALYIRDEYKLNVKVDLVNDKPVDKFIYACIACAGLGLNLNFTGCNDIRTKAKNFYEALPACNSQDDVYKSFKKACDNILCEYLSTTNTDGIYKNVTGRAKGCYLTDTVAILKKSPKWNNTGFTSNDFKAKDNLVAQTLLTVALATGFEFGVAKSDGYDFTL